MAKVFLKPVENKFQEHSKICFHNKEIVDYLSGETICKICGRVLNEKLNLEANPGFNSHEEWMNCSHNSSGNKIYSVNSSTNIDKNNLDYSGKLLSYKNNLDFSRLRKWDKRTKSSQEINLKSAFSLLEGSVSKLHLSENIQERAAYLYRKASKEGIVRGQGTVPILAASLYLACKTGNVPRSMSEICIVMNIPKKNLYRALTKFSKNIQIKTEIRKPRDYLPSLCSKVSCSEKTKRKAYEFLIQIEKNPLFNGRNPMVLCATALWLSLIQTTSFTTQSKFCQSCGMSTVSLRNNLRFIKKCNFGKVKKI